MKSMFMNYFKDGKLYQWDKNRDIFIITKTNIQEEFCLDQKGMEMFLKFDNPKIKLDKALIVQKGNNKATITVLSNEQLTIPKLEFENEFSVDIDKLKIANKFVSKSEVRPVLKGIKVGKDYITATDGIVAYRHTVKSNSDIIMVSQFVDALEGKGIITIKSNQQNVAYDDGEKIIIGRLYNGVYPNIEQIYNNVNTPNYIQVNKEVLLDIFKFSNDKDDTLIFEKNKITINGFNKFETELPMEFSGVKIGILLSKLQTIISCIKEEEIEIRYGSERTPLLINNEFLLTPIVLR